MCTQRGNMWRCLVLVLVPLSRGGPNPDHQDLVASVAACTTARVLSVGAADASEPGHAAFFREEVLPFRFFAQPGVNILVMNPKEKAQQEHRHLNRTYGPDAHSAAQLEQDLESLPVDSVILVAQKGTPHQAFLEPLRKIGAKLFAAVAPDQGYGLIGRIGSVPVEAVGSYVDIEHDMNCNFADVEADGRIRSAARQALGSAAGKSPEEVGALVKAQGLLGAEEAVSSALQRWQANDAGIPTSSHEIAGDAWRVAVAAGLSGTKAAQLVIKLVLTEVIHHEFNAGLRPAEVGRVLMDVARYIPDLTDEERVNASIHEVEKMLFTALFLAGESQETIRLACKEAVDGVKEGRVAEGLESMEEWLHPELKVDYPRILPKGLVAMSQIFMVRQAASSQGKSAIWSKANAVETAAVTAAASARGASPEEIGARTKEAVSALGSHAQLLAAKAAANVAMHQAIHLEKSAPEIGAAAQVAARAAGLHAADEWLNFKEHIARRVATWAVQKGLGPREVGRAVQEATVDAEGSGAAGPQMQEQLAAGSAAEVVAHSVARQKASAAEVALATRETIIGTGWKTGSMAIARMAGRWAAKAVAHEMADKDGWQEVAKAAEEAAHAALVPAEEVPRMAAETSSLEVAKAAVAHGKSGEEVGLAALAAIQASGVSREFSPVIASGAIASAMSSCHRLVPIFTARDVIAAARSAGAPGAVRAAMLLMSKCSAAESARLSRAPAEAALEAMRIFVGSGIEALEAHVTAGPAVASSLTAKSFELGSGAPLDLAREVTSALAQGARMGKHLAAGHAAQAAASCAVKVSLARKESGSSIGDFAVKVAKSTGVTAKVAKTLAAMTVSQTILASLKTVDAAALKHIQAAVLATGVSPTITSHLVVPQAVEAAVMQCLMMGHAIESCGAAAHDLVNASGLPKDLHDLSAQMAAKVAAAGAVTNGTSVEEVHQAARQVQGAWHSEAQTEERRAALAAAQALANSGSKSCGSAKALGQQVSAAAGRYHGEVAAKESARVMAHFAQKAGITDAAGLVFQAIEAIPGVKDAPMIAADALTHTAKQEASKLYDRLNEVDDAEIALRMGLAAYSALPFEEAVHLNTKITSAFDYQPGALNQVMMQQGFEKPHMKRLAAPAQRFVAAAAKLGGSWAEQKKWCAQELKSSGLWNTVKELQLEDEESIVAAAVAVASAQFHQRSGLKPHATQAEMVGRDVRCAAGAIQNAEAFDMPSPHLDYVAARAAASALCDALAFYGAKAEVLGQAAVQAVKGAAPAMPPEVISDLAVTAAAGAAAHRGVAPQAAVSALEASGQCPGKKSIPGARLTAFAVALHCDSEEARSPVHCGLAVHGAVRDVLVACNMGLTHAARLADAGLAVAFAQRASRTNETAEFEKTMRGYRRASVAAGMSEVSRVEAHMLARTREAAIFKQGVGKSAQEVGSVAKHYRSVYNFARTPDPEFAGETAAAAIEAVVRRNVLQHNSPDLIAREAHLVAHAIGSSDHQLLVTHAVKALSLQKAAMGASATALGQAAKNLALALAVAPVDGMNASHKELVSIRWAMFAAAEQAAKATILQRLKERHGAPIFAREAVLSALQAARATGHPLGGRQMARLVGHTVMDVSLKQGETSQLPELLKQSLLPLQLRHEDLLQGAFAAAKAVAAAAARRKERPQDIRKESLAVLGALPELGVEARQHLAAEASIEAVAEHGPQSELKKLGGLLRKVVEWDPVKKPLPGATAAMAARLARREAATAALAVLQPLRPAPGVLRRTQLVVEALGLPKAASQRISLHAAARAVAQLAARGAGDACREAGQMAHQVVLSGLPPEKVPMGAKEHRTSEPDAESHAFLSLALPAALKAAINAGPSDPEKMATCARSAAQGAIGKDARSALQGQWITEAADLAASQAAKTAVMEGRLPFQVTLAAEQAAASLRSSSPETHHSDGMAAAKAILHQGLEVSADHAETARMARVAAESSGLRIEEARHQVAEHLSSMLADQQAKLMSLDAKSSHAITKVAKQGAFDAGCKEAESAWIACHAATEAMAQTAAARGATTEVVAQVALAAAEASGVPQNQAKRISAWSAAKAATQQAQMLGASVAETGQTALAAARFAGLTGGTAQRLAAEAAAKAVLEQARDSSASHSHMAKNCKDAALAAGLPAPDASLLAASLVCPKAAEMAATMQRSPAQIGAITHAAAKAAGVEALQGAEEAGVAAASAAVQSALSDGGLHPAKVAQLAQDAWTGAGARGRTVAPCIAATAVLKRLASQRHAVPEDLADAAQAMAAQGSPAAKKQVASILAKAVAESAARRGGREEEVAHLVLKSLRDCDPQLPAEKMKEMTALAASTAVAKAAVQQGKDPAAVNAAAAKAAGASGMASPKEVKDMACVASAAAIAKHSKHVRQGASTVADLVLQAARSAGCEAQTPLIAAITAASRSAAKASLALHGTSAASMARAAWRAASEVLQHLGHGSDEDKSLWARIVSIEAVNDWQAQAFVAGLEGHAAEGKAKIEKVIAGVSQEQHSQWLSALSNKEVLGAMLVLCILGLCYWSGSRIWKAISAAFSIATGTDCDTRTVQKFCGAADEETLYSALNPPRGHDFQSLDDDEEPLRHNIAAHAGWFDREDRFSSPEKLVVILERAALEKSRELVGSHAKAPRPDHELQFTFDALEMLLDSELNQAGRLIIYLHSADDVIAEVHPGFCMPSSLQRFAKIMLTLLRKRRFTGSTPEAPAVLRVVDGPWDQILPKGVAWYALSPQGDSVHLKDFVREIAGTPGFGGCLPASSSSERMARLPPWEPSAGDGQGPKHVVFSLGASLGDATKDPKFRGNALQRISICPWDLTGAACCRMLCSEFEAIWGVHQC